MFVIFVYLFKETALSFIDIFYCLLASIQFTSTLIFVISFLLLTLDLLYYYFFNLLNSSFTCQGVLFIWDFFLLFLEAVITINIFLSISFASCFRFWCVVFPFSFVIRYLKFFSFDFFVYPLIIQ